MQKKLKFLTQEIVCVGGGVVCSPKRTFIHRNTKAVNNRR